MSIVDTMRRLSVSLIDLLRQRGQTEEIRAYSQGMSCVDTSTTDKG